jgi:hypothetical protein
MTEEEIQHALHNPDLLIVLLDLLVTAIETDDGEYRAIAGRVSKMLIDKAGLYQDKGVSPQDASMHHIYITSHLNEYARQLGYRLEN